ncbi:TPA: hypothetical protein ACHR7L_004705 [Yersinia enterocolitica]|nr:hypothetical protein [Yersinia enterocolitica]
MNYLAANISGYGLITQQMLMLFNLFHGFGQFRRRKNLFISGIYGGGRDTMIMKSALQLALHPSIQPCSTGRRQL